jgi:hypothetical protein
MYRNQLANPINFQAFSKAEFLNGAVVGTPAHPFRPWRHMPLIGVEAADRAQSRIDLRLAAMRLVYRS